ncbi:MAG: ATP-binding cassette domain-containing protein [Limnobacter sp.]|uniref:ATP-binding cassette domain-containing protein n=1 Tax=Limnobacter sp. TaxID=2003368 RepID=UPI00391B868C
MIQFSGVSLARGAKTILDGADLTLFPKEKVGLIGHNGAGKSTCFSALLGHLPLEAGSLDLPKTWSVSWIDQEVTATELTVLDYALQGDRALFEVRQAIAQAQATGEQERIAHLYERLDTLDGYTAESRVASILHGLGFKPADLQRKVGEFSGGWKMRMNLAKVLGSRADLVMLDEPTNHLDIEAVIWLAQWIRDADTTVLVISHDREFLDQVCTHIVHLNQAKLTKYTGNYSTFERTFAMRAEQIDQQNRKAQAERQKLQQFVDRFKAKASKAKQAQSKAKRLEKIQIMDSMQMERMVSIPFLEPQKSPDPLVVLNGADCGYPGGTPILKRVRLEIRPGDRIGLLGANGNGKTTLVRSILGELPLVEGDRVEGKGLVYGYFAQDQIESLDPDASPLTHMIRLDRQASEQNLRDYLARFDFRDDQVNQNTGHFSGGEKSRLALALLAYQRPNLLLLDEPTNHLDMATRQALVHSLLEYGGALVMVSHDRHLLESITDTYWRVHDGAVTEFDGDLDDYALMLRKEAASNNQAASASKPPAAQAVAVSKAERADQHQRLKLLKNQIKKLEKSQVELEAKLAQLHQQLEAIDYATSEGARQGQALEQQRQASQAELDDCENQLIESMVSIEELESVLGLSA